MAHTRDTRFYLKIFLGLALSTSAEVLTIYVGPFLWMRAALLLSLAFAQSLLLAMNIMHLRWDKLIFSALFFLEFTTAMLMVLAVARRLSDDSLDIAASQQK